jgi:hypothetical protein
VREPDGVSLVERLDEAPGEAHDAPRREPAGLGDQIAQRAAGGPLDGDVQPAAGRVAVRLELGGGRVPEPARRVGLADHPVDQRVVLHGARSEHVHAAGAAGRRVRRVVDVGHARRSKWALRR